MTNGRTIFVDGMSVYLEVSERIENSNLSECRIKL